MVVIENRTFDEMEIGDTVMTERVLTQEDIQLFAAVSGNMSPLHLDEAFAKSSPLHGITAQNMWGAALISGLLGTKLPGPGLKYLSQTLQFREPTRLGDRVTVSLKVLEKFPADKRVKILCSAVNGQGHEIFTGVAEVIAPVEKIRRNVTALPQVEVVDPYRQYRELIAMCSGKPVVPTAVVYPCDEVSLGGAIQAYKEKLIYPILCGPSDLIRKTADREKIDLKDIEIVDAPHGPGAAEKATEQVRLGKAKMLMKGALHTDELMKAIVSREGGMRTLRRISHCFVMDVPTYDKPLFITDAAINIQPDLAMKVDILQNAIDMAHALGVSHPKVAILSAVETVNSAIPSTLEAAALCKMADRGQITGAILDGPLAFDNAISAEAARIKKIQSPVSGAVDILMVPDLESGNMLFKQLCYLANAMAAGVVLGAKVPVVLTSRADGELARMASCAVGMLLANAKNPGGQ